MSLATRCTHCGTIFKVVQDQLKVSEGWVRCGRCHEVFNALPALFDLDTEAPPPRQTPHHPAQGPGWSRTQPAGFDAPPTSAPVSAPPPPPMREAASPTPISAHTPLTSADLSFGGGSPPAPPPPAATDFDLDTSIDLSDPTPPWSPPASEGHSADHEVTPPPEDVPSTDEADALESRYLLPSRDASRPVRRRENGPEFADAQFPSDLDAEQEWARYQDSIPAPVTEPPPLSSLPASALGQPDAVAPPQDVPTPLPAAVGAVASTDASEPQSPRPFDPDFVPEQPVQPPSQRKGRSGTRGRDPASQAPEFVRRAQRRAFWRLPVVQAVMGLLTLLLALALTVQLGHHFRDWIAAHAPSTRPLLQTWCAQVGCKIQPPLRLDALQVDSANLVRTASEGPDRYRLTVAVHNRSDVELAWPHIDLTLTDDRGTVIARRAFAPRDAQIAKGEGMPLLSVPESVPAGESTQLQWSLRLSELAPAGYTAELFYP
jgi:predicted Zn finger-like uncharacterized protein